ncbi:Hdr-like menaquinol oxidoreductase cytochrome c subunit [Gammaproteobacteria bacterium]
MIGIGTSIWWAGLLALTMAVTGVSVAQDVRSGLLGVGSKAVSSPQCVEPRDVMRRYHMDYIRHQRDLTVREGVRDGRYSLAVCVDCHVQRDVRGQPIPIDEEKQFCRVCHAEAAVRIDCFSCHSRVP